MTARRALVVDDSRSARAFLTRILERYELQVDAVETAEQAIDYLTRQRPDVIFMDHLMPGMDGFQAVQAIKNNPRTATIPIMMYTSQEGELYLSQARALGAIGVLPKQIKHADVSKALEQLHLRPEDAHAPTQTHPPVQESVPESVPVHVPPSPPPSAPLTDAPPARAPAAARGPRPDVALERRGPDRPNLPALPPEQRMILEAMLAHHGRELRRFMVDNLETQTDRILGDMRQVLQDSMPEPPVEPSAARNLAPWLAAAGLLLGVLFGVLWWQRQGELGTLNNRLSQSQQQLTQTQQALQSANAKATAAAAAAQSSSEGGAGNAGDRSTSLVEPVPFGEAPLAGARVEQVAAVLARLTAAGFHGVVQIRSIPGRYCMVSGPGGAMTLASDNTPYARCEQIGNPHDDDDTGEGRQSVAFADMLATARASAGYEIQINAADADEAAHPYPTVSDTLTAGEWNRAAAANNRVELRWQASSP
ncbi:MAG TPA: response regulator [Steroidobacteraceae bacterium]|jgi:CheY-like chemotaxis protein|nr:response regulator [Steroidobacteraceae bacterium]